MKIAAVVQARTSSRRLSGKVLREINGKPLIGYLFERLRRSCELNGLILATSTDRSDDALADWARAARVACFRGPLEDVAARYLAVSDHHGLQAFVRITGDSPLIDPAVVDRGVALFRNSAADLVTNVMPRSFPKGQSVEVVRAKAFASARTHMSSPVDREHVTMYFYRHPEAFVIENFAADQDTSHVRLCVDTEQDLAAVTKVVSAMDRPHWTYGYAEILELAGRET